MDVYISSLTAFHESMMPFLRGMQPDHPEFHSAVGIKEAAHATLARASRDYWNHINAHRCRQKEEYGSA